MSQHHRTVNKQVNVVLDLKITLNKVSDYYAISDTDIGCARNVFRERIRNHLMNKVMNVNSMETNVFDSFGFTIEEMYLPF